MFHHPQLVVARNDRVAAVGEKASVIHPRTQAEAGRGPSKSINTRVPRSTMHDWAVADVVAKKAHGAWSSPHRVCARAGMRTGSGHRRAAQRRYTDETEFIQCAQVAAWRLPSAPWVFTTDLKGKVAARLEGAYMPGSCRARSSRRAG